MVETGRLLTLGDVARECGAKPSRVKYALTEYRIEPHQRAGILRLFHPEQIPEIKAALRRIANRREVARA
jgi:hypothetical protein